MKMQLKHSLAYLAALCGMLGMAWGAHADWFYDFQKAPPSSFVTGPGGPPSATFSSSVGDGVLQLSDTTLPANGGAAVGAGLETSQVFTDVRVTGTVNPAGTTNNLLLLLARDDGIGNDYSAGIAFANNQFGSKAGTLEIILHAAKNEAGLNVWKLWVIKEFSFSR
jgi:hypothetical protein